MRIDLGAADKTEYESAKNISYGRRIRIVHADVVRVSIYSVSGIAGVDSIQQILAGDGDICFRDWNACYGTCHHEISLPIDDGFEAVGLTRAVRTPYQRHEFLGFYEVDVGSERRIDGRVGDRRGTDDAYDLAIALRFKTIGSACYGDRVAAGKIRQSGESRRGRRPPRKGSG